MPRLRDVRTGVVVSVDADTAAALAATHKSVEPKAAAKKATARKSSK